MSTESKVGLFVVVSLVVLVAAVYFVQTTQTVKGQVGYRTYFNYAGGIAPGANVLFGGIKVGQVTSVHPWVQDPTRIEVLFEVKTGTPVNADSTARVSSVSLMSSPVLSLTTGSNEARRLQAGEIVPSQESMGMEEITRRIARLTDSVNQLVVELNKEIPKIVNEAQTLLMNLNQISGPANQKRIESILTEFDQLMSRESVKIAEISDRLSTLVGHADSVVLSVEPLVANMDKTVGNVNATVDAVREPLTRDLEELESTIVQARTLLASVQTVVQTNDRDIAETVRNLRSASENIQSLTETLKQRPWSLLRITQPPDREVPK